MTPAGTGMTFDECCRAIVAARGQPAVNYAVGYARAGIGMTGREREIQALYLLNNITHWRGGQSKEVRAALKEGWK